MISPEISHTLSEHSVDAYQARLQELDASAQALYAKIQQLPKESLDLPQMRKVISLMLELKKRLSPEETIQTIAETANKMPNFVETEDRAAQTFRNEIKQGVAEGKGFLASVKDIFADAFLLVTKAVQWLINIISENPKLLPALFPLFFAQSGVSAATSLVNSLMAGGTENGNLIRMLMKAMNRSDAEIAAFQKDGWKGLAKEWAMAQAQSALTGSTATAAAAGASAKIVTNIAGKSIAPALAESSTVFRALGWIASRAGALGLLFMPKEMGNSEIIPDKQATPEEQAKTMKYIQSLPKAN